MTGIHGLLLQVDGAEALVEAARLARGKGASPIDAFSPFPVEGLTDALGFRHSRAPWVMFFAGIAGGLLAFGTMTFSAVAHYPIIVGGRPRFSWPAFVPITFELTVLFAAIGGAIALAVLSRLPKYYHPVFNDRRFRNETQAGFFLLLEDSPASRRFLESFDPGAWKEVPE